MVRDAGCNREDKGKCSPQSLTTDFHTCVCIQEYANDVFIEINLGLVSVGGCICLEITEKCL